MAQPRKVRGDFLISPCGPIAAPLGKPLEKKVHDKASASMNPINGEDPTTPEITPSTEYNALTMEKTISSNLLNYFFSKDIATSLFTSLYPESVNTPIFLSGDTATLPTAPTQSIPTPGSSSNPVDANGIPAQAWCRFEVKDFVLKHFAKDLYPPCMVELVQLNGDPIPRMVGEDGAITPLSDVRVRLQLFNKWADVTKEVLPDLEAVRTLKDGKCYISDLSFQEISLKHGGYFILCVNPIDYNGEVVPWKSDKIIIQSVKTHSNKRRREASTKASPSMKSSNDPFASQHFLTSESIMESHPEDGFSTSNNRNGQTPYTKTRSASIGSLLGQLGP